MKKSLFSKLMSTYLIVIIISYILVSVFLSIWFFQHFYKEKKIMLINQGSHIEQVIVKFANNKINKTDMMIQMSMIEDLMNTKISIYDNYGYKIGEPVNEDPRTLKNPKLVVSKEDLLTVMAGNEIVKTGEFSDIFTSYVLSVGMPVNVSDNVTYSLFLHSSLGEIKNTLGNVFFVIWTVAFLAICICAFIVYYFSEKILITPLNRMNTTARQIANGEFGNRVDIVSEDEIGDLAESFNYMADSFENLENMRRSFIGNVSHELRSPMTSINGFVEGMVDGTISSEKWGKYLKVVNGESKRLIRIINDLLDLAKLESGEFSMHMGEFEINELISECVLKSEDKINRKNITMKITLIKDRIIVIGDRDRINQVVTNLLDNAIKFVPKDGIIEIIVVKNEERVVISIFNTGEPIPRSEINSIWDRFHKVDKARGRSDGGVGLGLSIVRQIINQHNQTVWVQSSAKGNVFNFTIDYKV
ncbi:MAG: ATP-binding protein [Clostridium sp.]